jgi:hypothetical protein
MDVKKVLDKFKKVIEDEKKQLDNILRGAELLAEMLAGEQKASEQQRAQVEYSEPGLETAPGTGQRNPI